MGTGNNEGFNKIQGCKRDCKYKVAAEPVKARYDTGNLLAVKPCLYTGYRELTLLRNLRNQQPAVVSYTHRSEIY